MLVIMKKTPKSERDQHVGISGYKNIFAKRCTTNWSEKVFIVKQIMDTAQLTYIISNYNVEKIIGRFYEKNLQKKNKTKFRVEKVINRKGDKLYVKYKGCGDKFNSWIDEKDVV